MLQVSEAQQRILRNLIPTAAEIIHTWEANGRVLAEDLAAPADLPYFTHSSMDGFAVRSADVAAASEARPAVLEVIEDIPAGTQPSRMVKGGQASRIMTGAVLPGGADTVVPVEDTDHFAALKQINAPLPRMVRIYRGARAGENVRNRGQDLQKGKVVLKRSRLLKPQDVGLLAMLGIERIAVFERPRVVMFSTGDELLPVDQALEPGKIHDSNSYTLSAQVSRDGGEPIYLGIIPDREAAVRDALQTAIGKRPDLIISSAGVSVGAFDFVKTVVEQDGSIEFWKVNMRPGKPLAYGSYRRLPFIGLPGNPVSAFVGYEVFVRPAVRRLAGRLDWDRHRVKVHLAEEIESDGRESYLRCVVEKEGDDLVARLTVHQGSGNLLSLVNANALLIIPSGVKSLPSKAEVEAWLIDEDLSF